MNSPETLRIFNEPVANLESLRSNSYPGRGIIMGVNNTGELVVQLYWVMGRSENSRNRVLVKENSLVKTKAYDETKVKDPSLIIYNAMRDVMGIPVVSNGDQTDTIADFIGKGRSFEETMATRTFEDDEPIFTPRISGIYLQGNSIPFRLSIIRRNPENGEPIREFNMMPERRGKGYCVHTYKENGDPPPPFDEPPYPLPLIGSLEEIAQTYWDALNKENRVALVAKGIDKTTGGLSYEIINALKQ